MNPASSKRHQTSEEEMHANVANEGRSVTQQWTMDAEGENAPINSLPNEILLKIFGFLSMKQLRTAEQVCSHWRDIVNVRFATMTKTLQLFGAPNLNCLKKMKRFGPTVKCVKLSMYGARENNIDWIAEIANSFPNLSSLKLWATLVRTPSLKDLPVKCCKLAKISIIGCKYIDDHGIEIILKGLPGLKSLTLSRQVMPIGECFRELGSNVEHLRMTSVHISQEGCSHILSRGTNLQTLQIDGEFKCDADNFKKFCEKSPLKTLKIGSSQLPKEVFLSISCLSLLEQLQLSICDAVDSEVLIWISFGCPNLTHLHLSGLSRVCDRGVKRFAQCRRLTHLNCSHVEAVTDESLFKIAKAGLLESFTIGGCKVTERGVTAILGQCPRLGFLEVCRCSGIGDSTVDAAIKAVEIRGNFSGTVEQIPCASSSSMVPRFESVKAKGCLLHLRISGQIHLLDRYKYGYSHPLLFLEID